MYVHPQKPNKVARPRDDPKDAKPDLAMTPEAVCEWNDGNYSGKLRYR